jgi:hypothetical protein
MPPLFNMARGWESKSVEDQIDERAKQRESQSVDELTPEERLRRDRLASLQLSKSRLLAQLERAKHPTHRTILLKGLKAIEKQIEET